MALIDLSKATVWIWILSEGTDPCCGLVGEGCATVIPLVLDVVLMTCCEGSWAAAESVGALTFDECV